MIKESVKKPNSIIKSSSYFGLTTLVSRLTGFLRDVLFASYFGAGASTDAFFVAFKIPNFFRRLFAEGSINNAFIPMYLEIKKRNGEKKAELFVGKFISMLLIFLVIFISSII